ncbi:hypothetical protein PAMP_001807 [Pampus punctatissimus]
MEGECDVHQRHNSNTQDFTSTVNRGGAFQSTGQPPPANTETLSLGSCGCSSAYKPTNVQKCQTVVIVRSCDLRLLRRPKEKDKKEFRFQYSWKQTECVFHNLIFNISPSRNLPFFK